MSIFINKQFLKAEFVSGFLYMSFKWFPFLEVFVLSVERAWPN